jgi:hypothetical protein
VDIINNECFHTPKNDPKFPYLFCTNEANAQKIMNEFSFKMKGMYSYCMLKIDIMRHVFNHFNYKITQTS